MERRFMAATFVLAVATLAVGVQLRQLTINGVAYPDSLMSSGGKTYVAIDALRKAGAQVSVSGDRVSIQFQPLAGREQQDAIEGRIEEWIQNAAWRIRVTNVETTENPFGRGPGVAVTFELRNLAQRAVSPFATGMDKLQVVDDKGIVLQLAAGTFGAIYNSIPPAGSITVTARFGDPGNDRNLQIGRPEKLLVLFRSTGGRPPLKAFRIFLQKEDGLTSSR